MSGFSLKLFHTSSIKLYNFIVLRTNISHLHSLTLFWTTFLGSFTSPWACVIQLSSVILFCTSTVPKRKRVKRKGEAVKVEFLCTSLARGEGEGFLYFRLNICSLALAGSSGCGFW